MLIHQVIDKVENLHGLHVSVGHLCLHMLGMISGLAGVFRAENNNAASHLACHHLVWKKFQVSDAFGSADHFFEEQEECCLGFNNFIGWTFLETFSDRLVNPCGWKGSNYSLLGAAKEAIHPGG